jgi:hypothetical protein
LIDLQLSYLSLGLLQFKNLQKNWFKQSQMKFKRADPRHTRDVAHDAVAARRPARLVRARRGPPPTAGLCVVPWSLCSGTVNAV